MISILIPTKRGDDLQRCLDSIHAHTKNYEIIILDYDSGYNQKLNDGFKRSVGDYISILHDDCEVLEGWADNLSDIGCLKYLELGREIYGGMFSNTLCHEGKPDYTAFLIMKREIADKVFPLDEFYKSPWCADADMGRKIQSLGLIINPLKGKIIHHHSYGAGKPVPENEQYYKEKWS